MSNDGSNPCNATWKKKPLTSVELEEASRQYLGDPVLALFFVLEYRFLSHWQTISLILSPPLQQHRI